MATSVIDNAPWVHGDLIAVDSGEMGAGIQFYSRLKLISHKVRQTGPGTAAGLSGIGLQAAEVVDLRMWRAPDTPVSCLTQRRG